MFEGLRNKKRNTMFKIGDFSKLSFVPVKTLRYYDEIGLLKPVRIDPFTGYRYYSAEQLPRLNCIIALKNMGLSLDEISVMTKNSLSPSRIRDLFIKKKVELQQRIGEEQTRLNRVEKLLERIEKEGKMPDYQVVIKNIDQMKIASIRDTVPDIQDISVHFRTLNVLNAHHASSVAGPFMVIYHDMEYREKDVDVEVAIPIKEEVSLPDPIKIRDLPGETVASLVHKGPYETMDAPYQALMTWCESNGYELAGPDRHLFLKTSRDVQDPEEYINEMQQPVRKA